MASHFGIRKNVGPVLCVIDCLVLRGQTQNSLKNFQINQTPRFCRMQSVFLGLCDEDIDISFPASTSPRAVRQDHVIGSGQRVVGESDTAHSGKLPLLLPQ